MATVHKTVRLRTELLVISIVITIITQFARFFFFSFKNISSIHCYRLLLPFLWCPLCNDLFGELENGKNQGHQVSVRQLTVSATVVIQNAFTDCPESVSFSLDLAISRLVTAAWPDLIDSNGTLLHLMAKLARNGFQKQLNEIRGFLREETAQLEAGTSQFMVGRGQIW